MVRTINKKFTPKNNIIIGLPKDLIINIEEDKMTETLISDVCKTCQENKIISCCTENKETVCPKEHNRGIFRKECIGL